MTGCGAPQCYPSCLRKREPMNTDRAIFLSRGGAPSWAWCSCWGGRPPTASLCQNEVAQISNKGAVHERDYPHWGGHVQACFSGAWGSPPARGRLERGFQIGCEMTIYPAWTKR